jgi:3-phosphoshikimate 1-carboxyvinyltransferase
MQVIVKKTASLTGQVCAPPSKSFTQRMLIASSLSEGISRISNPLLSEDTEATTRAVMGLGAEIHFSEDCWTIQGRRILLSPKEPIDCGESGATFRFLIPIAALANGFSTLVFQGSIEKRPVYPLIKSLGDLGAAANVGKFDGKDAVFVQGGGIRGGKTSISGDISSQFISGLMFACPLAKENAEISLTSPMESVDYVKMTQEVLVKHAISIGINEKCITIPANQTYKAVDSTVPGDFSSAAFLLAAAAITKSTVTVSNLDYTGVQGDRTILSILKRMGVRGKICSNSIEIEGEGSLLQPADFEVQNIPDLVPAIAVLACYANGTSRIFGAKRLRFKESDRLTSLYLELGKMGAQIYIKDDGLIIKGGPLHGAVVDPHNDHRIAMACAVAGLGAKGETSILNAQCIRKSYPQFFTHLRQLGANIDGWELVR